MDTISPPTLSEQDLTVLAEDFLDALLSAADIDVIGKKNWWDRANSALETAAAAATWPACVAKACKKLQIKAPDVWLSKEVDRLAVVLGDEPTYQRFSRLVERDAIYVTAMVRARRADRNGDRADKQDADPAKPKPAKTPAVDADALPGF